ncbi:MAG: nitroreductase family protein, partial [Candidatus Poribacteria bacterium]
TNGGETMDFWEVITKRRSIRKYKPDPIPEGKLQKLYEALRLAPSGGNRQNYSFIFVMDEEKRKRIATEAGHQGFLEEAPVLMVAVCDPGNEFNVAIAVDHMILSATNEGLGTCWVGWFEREPVKKILGIPDSKVAVILVPIGFPDENPDPRPRKSLDQLIMIDSFRS